MQGAAITLAIRERLLLDHEQLDTLFERLLVALAKNIGAELASHWSEFEFRLRAHMDMEESYLIPLLHQACAKNARILIQEHRHIRARLIALPTELERNARRVDVARAFVDELRAHSRSEDRLLYEWVHERLGPQEKASVAQALSAHFGP